jgi:poly(hydroxyalkanoate) granule-associated protein
MPQRGIILLVETKAPERTQPSRRNAARRHEESGTMQTTKNDVRQRIEKVQDGVRGSAHTAWLAGLGAVALAGEQGRGLFDQLVDRGRKLEARGRQEVGRAKGEAGRARRSVGSKVDELGATVDRRVADAMHRLGIPTRDEVATLTRRIEEMTARVSELPSATAAPAAAAPRKAKAPSAAARPAAV